jgi:hypothetical protein
MSFLRPEFLWGLGALAIPVIIHLFSFRRTRKVFFSNTRFISQIKEETSAKRKIKQWLILSARILFLFFLVLAFAQPFLQANKQRNAGKPVVLYVDNSFSMTIQNGNATLMEQAIGYTQNLVKAFPPDTRFVFFTNNTDSYSSKPRTAQEITEYLTQLKPSLQTKSFFDLIQKHKQWVNTDALFVISDFQEEQFKNTEKADTLNYVLVPFQKENNSNIFFDSVYLQNPFLLSGEKNKLVCVMQHAGNETRTQVLIKLLIDDKQVGTVITDLQPNAIKNIEFEIPAGLTGIKRARLSVADAGNAFDNDFYISLDFSEKINIAEVRSDQSTDYVRNVFANENVFQFNSFSELNVNYEKASLANLLVINELPTLPTALRNASEKVLQKGGSVLVIPSANPDVASYNALLSGVAVVKWSEKLSLKKIDYNNPFFSNVFETKQDNVALPTGKAVWLPIAKSQAVLSYVNDSPMLTFTQNVGRVYMFTSPLQPVYSTIGTHALFVPVMYKMAALSKNDGKPLSITGNEFILQNLPDNKEQNRLVKLVGNTELVPEQTPLAGKLFLNFDNLSLSPGHYYAVSGADTLSLLAANASKKESSGEFLKGEELVQKFGGRSTVVNNAEQTPEQVKTWIDENYKGKPLWKLALVLALLFVAAEIMLIRLLK